MIPTLGLIAGCSTAAQTGTPGSSRDVITSEEIAPVVVSDAFELVQRLRPSWLRRRTSPAVYVDGVRRGRASELRNLLVQNIAEMRYLSPNDATLRYGTGHVGGAIEVTTKR